MAVSNIWDYQRVGTPENILVKAGLVKVDDKGETLVLEAGPKLAGLFTDNAVPQLDAIAPHMVDLVKAYAFEKAGFINPGDMRIQSAGALRDAGMGNVGLQTFNQAIVEAAEAAKGEVAAARTARR